MPVRKQDIPDDVMAALADPKEQAIPDDVLAALGESKKKVSGNVSETGTTVTSPSTSPVPLTSEEVAKGVFSFGQFQNKKAPLPANIPKTQKTIESALKNVHFGAINQKQLTDLYNDANGKEVAKSIIKQYAPEATDENIDNPAVIEVAAKNIKQQNRINFVNAEKDSIIQADENLSTTVADLNKGLSGNQAGRMTEYINELRRDISIDDLNNNDKISDVISRIKKVTDLEQGYIVNPEEKRAAADKAQGLLNTLNNRLLYNISRTGVSPTLNQLDDQIQQAVISKVMEGERGEKGESSDKDQIKLNQFKLGLTAIEKSDPVLFKNVVNSISSLKKVADTDFSVISKIGQHIDNQVRFRGAAYDQNLIDTETEFEYDTFGQKKSAAAGAIGEWMKEKGHKNMNQFPEALIRQAAKETGINNPEIVNSLVFDEKLGGYDAIPKSGWVDDVTRGIMQPLEGINSTLNSWNESPAQTYLRSKDLSGTFGSQKVPDKKGGYSDILESEHSFTTDMFRGLGQFIPQILLTKGVGGAVRAGAGLTGAELSATQAKNVADYGGTFISTFLQSYGPAYEEHLQKTGDANTSALIGTIDGISSGAFELILPDVKIAGKAFDGLKQGLSNDLIGLIKKGGDPAELLTSARPFVQKFFKSATNTLVQENLEELGTQYTDFVTESILDPQSAKDRNINKELWDTFKSTTAAMLLPSIMGAAGGSFTKDFTTKSLHSAAINLDSYKESLQNSLDKEYISQDDYNKSLKILQTHQQSIGNAPEINANGQTLAPEKKLDYALEDTKIKVYKEKAAATEGVAKEMWEGKIKQAEDVQREILMPKEAPVEEAIVAEEEVVAPEAKAEVVAEEVKTSVNTDEQLFDKVYEKGLSINNILVPEKKTESISILKDQALSTPNNINDKLDGDEELTTDLIASNGVEKINTQIQSLTDQQKDPATTDQQTEEIDKHLSLLDKGLEKATILESKNNTNVSQETQAQTQGAEETGVLSQEGAAETTEAAPYVSKFPKPSKPIYQLNSTELKDHAKSIKAYQKNQEIEFFGEEGAKKYKAALRTANNAIADREDVKKAQAIVNEMEDSLSPGQYDDFFGANQAHGIYDPQEIIDVANKVSMIEGSENVQDLSRSLKIPILSFSKNQNDEGSLAVLNAAKNKADELGIDPKELIAKSIENIIKDIPDNIDKEFLAKSIFDRLSQPTEQPQQKQIVGEPIKPKVRVSAEQVEKAQPKKETSSKRYYAGDSKGKNKKDHLYLTSSPEYAKNYGDKIVEYRYSPKNTLDASELGEKELSSDDFKSFLSNKGVEDVSTKIHEEGFDNNMPFWMWVRRYPEVIKLIRDAGFDSIIHGETFTGRKSEKIENTIVALNPSEVIAAEKEQLKTENKVDRKVLSDQLRKLLGNEAAALSGDINPNNRLSLKDIGFKNGDTVEQAIDKAIAHGEEFSGLLNLIKADPYLKNITLEFVDSLPGGEMGLYHPVGHGEGKDGLLQIADIANVKYSLVHELNHFLTLDSKAAEDVKDTAGYKGIEELYNYVAAKKGKPVTGSATLENYGLTNVKEFMAEMLINPTFRNYVSDIFETNKGDILKTNNFLRDSKVSSIGDMIANFFRDLFNKLLGNGQEGIQIDVSKSVIDNAVKLATDLFLGGQDVTSGQTASIGASIPLNARTESKAAALGLPGEMKSEKVNIIKEGGNVFHTLRRIKDAYPQYKTIADDLLSLADKDSLLVGTRLINPENAPTRAWYNSQVDKIYFDGNFEKHPKVILHEVIHAMTASKIPERDPKIYTGASYLKTLRESVKENKNPVNSELIKLYLDTVEDSGLWGYFFGNEGIANDFFNKGKLDGSDLFHDNYALFNIHEFLADSFSSPNFQEKLKNIKSGSSTMWDRFVEFVKKALGLKINTRLDEVLDVGRKIISSQRPEFPDIADSNLKYYADFSNKNQIIKQFIIDQIKEGAKLEDIKGALIDNGIMEEEAQFLIDANKPKVRVTAEDQTKGFDNKPKSILNRISESKNIPENIKEKFSSGLTYNPQSHSVARDMARAIIKEFGLENSISMAEAGRFNGDVNSLIFAEAIDQTFEREQAATTPEGKQKLAEQWADYSMRYDEAARQKGRFISAVYDFYKKSPLGIVIAERSNRDQIFKKWLKNKEGNYKEVFNELSNEPEFKQYVKEKVEVQLKSERAVTRMKRRDKISNIFDSAKFKGDALHSSLVPPQLWNAAVEVMKQAALAGETIANIIDQGISHIKDNHSESWDVEQFRKEWEEKLKAVDGDSDAKAPSKDNQQRILDRFRRKLSGLDDKQKEDVIRRSFKTLVENGALEYDEFKKIVADVMNLGELSPEEIKKITEYVKDVNSVQDAADNAQKERTTKALEDFQKIAKKAERSATELGNIVNSKTDLLQRVRSIIQLNTLGVVSLIKNPIYNIFHQSLVRLPKGLIMTGVDQAVYGLSLLSNKLTGSAILKPQTNIFLAQKGYFKQGGKGGSEAINQVFTGLTSLDYFQKEIRTSQIKPAQAWRDIWQWKKGEKFLDNAQIADRLIQGTVGIPAEAVARMLNIGDKPFRFAAQAAMSETIATQQFGLKGIDKEIFTTFPKEEATRLYKEKGMDHDSAVKKAEALEKRIVDEGEQAVFQQKNLVMEGLNGLGAMMKNFSEDKPIAKGGVAIAKIVGTLNTPFLKTPLNIFWELFNLVTPEVALTQSAIYGFMAGRAKFKGDSEKASEYAFQAKKWMAHGATGYALLATFGYFASIGAISGGGDDDSAKERKGKKTYQKAHALNLAKVMRAFTGGNTRDEDDDLMVDLSWFGAPGMIMNIQADRYENMTQEERDKMSYIAELQNRMHGAAADGLENSIFQGTIAGINAFKQGGRWVNTWVMNQVNVGSNFFQPATFSQFSRGTLPYNPAIKADNFAQELKNNFAARSLLFRAFAGYPPSDITIWGDKAMRNNTGAKGVAFNMLGFDEYNKDTFAEPIFQDYKRTGNSSFFPTDVRPTMTVDGQDKKMTVEQERQFKTLVGQARKSLVAPFVNDMATFKSKDREINGKTYNELSDEQKVKALNVVYKKGYEAGKAQFKELYSDFQAEKEREEE